MLGSTNIANMYSTTSLYTPVDISRNGQRTYTTQIKDLTPAGRSSTPIAEIKQNRQQIKGGVKDQVQYQNQTQAQNQYQYQNQNQYQSQNPKIRELTREMQFGTNLVQNKDKEAFSTRSQHTDEKGESHVDENSYIEKLWGKKRDMTKYTILTFVILFALSLHSLIEYLYDQIFIPSNIMQKQKIIIKILYPVVVCIILWNIKTFFL